MNIRDLSLLYKACFQKHEEYKRIDKTILLTEIIMRCMKSVFRGVMRHIKPGPTSDPCNLLQRELLLHFNYLLGESTLAEEYFEVIVKLMLVTRFDLGGFTLTRKQILTPDVKLNLFHTLQERLGLTFGRYEYETFICA